MHRLHKNHNILCAEHFHILDQGKSDHTAKENIEKDRGYKISILLKRIIYQTTKKRENTNLQSDRFCIQKKFLIVEHS